MFSLVPQFENYFWDDRSKTSKKSSHLKKVKRRVKSRNVLEKNKYVENLQIKQKKSNERLKFF